MDLWINTSPSLELVTLQWEREKKSQLAHNLINLYLSILHKANLDIFVAGQGSPFSWFEPVRIVKCRA